MKKSHFKPLHVPETWKHYWTKYPEGYTILESLMSWVSQVDEMVKHINSLDDFLEIFIQQFDKKLQDTVRELIKEMYEDGVLADIINEEVFGELNRRTLSIVRVSDFVEDGTENLDNTENIQMAVDKAKSESKLLLWDKHVRANNVVTNFHSVRHIGVGSVYKGATTFKPSPAKDNTNIIYVRENGSDENDGLTADKAFLTLQRALDVLPNYGSPLLGRWKIHIGAGTYTKAIYPRGLESELPVIIEGQSVGGYPNTPVTVITNGNGHVGHGFTCSTNTRVEIHNLKFTGYNGPGATSSGASAINGSELKSVNCHFENCFYGLQGQHNCNVDFDNGVFTNCGYRSDGTTGGAGYRSLGITRHYIGIQDGTDFSKGARFVGCYRAILVMDNCTGHINTITIEDCAYGVTVTNNSRINGTNIRYINNTIAMQMQNGGSTNIDKGNLFQGNTMGAQVTGGGSIRGEVVEGKNTAYNKIFELNAVEDIDRTYTRPYGIVFEQKYLYPFLTQTRASSNLGKVIEFEIHGHVTGRGDVKEVGATVRSGATHQNIRLSFSSNEEGNFTATGTILFTRFGTQVLKLFGGVHGSSFRVYRERSELSTENDITLEYRAGVASEEDSIHIDTIIVKYTN